MTNTSLTDGERADMKSKWNAEYDARVRAEAALGSLLGELKVAEEVPSRDDLDEVMEMAVAKVEALKAWRARARELRRQRDKERAKKETLYERLVEAEVERDQSRLGIATTRELLDEVRARMDTSQNSLKGRELGRLCSEALDNLDAGVLDYATWRPAPASDRVAAVEESLGRPEESGRATGTGGTEPSAAATQPPISLDSGDEA